jgi:hypothetical protein
MTDRKGSTTTEGTNKLVEKYLKEVDDDEDSGKPKGFFLIRRKKDKATYLIVNLIL